jgi:hypothetical protein
MYVCNNLFVPPYVKCVDGEEIRTVTIYKSLGVLITNDGYIHDEIKRIITFGKAAMAKLKNCERLRSFDQHKS